jgi:hypothetical protein
MKGEDVKKIMLISIAVAMMLFFSACTNEGRASSQKDIVIGQVDYPWYDSIDTLYEKADMVIRAKILDSRVEWMSHGIEQGAKEGSDQILNPGAKNDDKVITTIYTAEINAIYKGSPVTTIEVLQLGGETDTEIYMYEGTQQINIKKEYVMFLSKSTLNENAAWLLNNIQAIYKVEGKNLIKFPQNTLDLTYEDLTMLKIDDKNMDGR